MHAGTHELFVHRGADVVVKTAQHGVAAIDLADLDAQAGKDLRKFAGDIAAAGDDHMLGQAFQMEGLVGSDAQLRPLDLGDIGRAADRDQDVMGADRTAGLDQFHRVGVDQLGTFLDQLDAGIGQIAGINAGQAADLVILGGNQLFPAEGGLADRPAIAFGQLEGLGELAGIDQEFLGHAAADDAGAARPVLLGDRDLPGPVHLGHAGRPHPAGAGTNDEKVVVKFGHACAPHLREWPVRAGRLVVSDGTGGPPPRVQSPGLHCPRRRSPRGRGR